MHPAERGELEAFRDLFLAAPPGLGARSEEVAGALCIALPETPRSAMFNRVLGLGLEEPATPDLLNDITDFFGALGVEWCVALSPHAEPLQLRAWLDSRGFVPGYAWAKFHRAVEEPAERETELRIVEAEAGAAAADFAEAFVRAYGTPELFGDWLARVPGRPGWRCFVAVDGEAPAAAGALFAKGGVGWLGIAATLPEHRRRGAQGAILAARIRAAAEERCHVLVTETGEQVEGRPSASYRNIERAGFELAYVRPNYLSSPAADTSGTR
jgi:GNAT superfamily N-acetyltransferase